MINLPAIILTAIGKEAFVTALDAVKGNKTGLQKAYDKAFAKTVKWYEAKYAESYGAKNERFFDYVVVEEQLAKLLYFQQEPETSSIDQELLNVMTPTPVMNEFLQQLKQNMADDFEWDKFAATKEDFRNAKGTRENTDQIKEDIHVIKEHFVGKKQSVKYKPLNWQTLYKAFKDRRLDKVDIKHVGGGMSGPETLDLKDVFFEQDISGRSITYPSAKVLAADLYINFPIHNYWDVLYGHIWRIRQENHSFPNKIDYAGKDDKKENELLLEKIFQFLDEEGLTEHSSQFDKLLKYLAKEVKKTENEILFMINWLFETGVEREPSLQFLNAPCSYLLVGDAGMGKTTLMRRFALELYENLEKDGDDAPVPIFVRLDKISDFIKEDEQTTEEGVRALQQYICSHWKKDLGCPEDLTAESIADYKANLQILLDGLDEIPSRQLRIKLVRIVEAWRKYDWGMLRFVDVIITSRPSAIDHALTSALKMPQVNLLSLVGNQIPNFVKNFFIHYNYKIEKRAKKDSDAFVDALELSEAAKEFATNPLYLTVMILMHRKLEVLPRKRLELYKEFYEMLLYQRSKGPGKGRMGDKPIFKVKIQEKDPVVWHEPVFTPLLRQIAFLVHSNDSDSVSITPEIVEKAFIKKRKDREVNHISMTDLAKAFLDFADNDLGVLVSRGAFRGFSHRSIQEYLAAMNLAKSGQVAQMEFWSDIAMKKPDRWTEVARLLFCELREEDYLSEYLESQWPHDLADTKDPRVLEMISACLSDLEDFFQDEGGIKILYNDVVKSLTAKRDQNYENPQIFLTCTNALGLLDEPKIDVSNPPMLPFEAKEPFQMGSNKDKHEQPIHPVKLSRYWLGVYPVTNKEFAEFMKHGGYEKEEYWFSEDSPFAFDGRKEKKDGKWRAPRYWNDDRFGKKRPLAPVVGVSWYEAMAYCRWWTLTFGEQWAEKMGLDNKVTMRLPTEAEWEFAARGYKVREYSWEQNQQPQIDLANFSTGKLDRTTAIGSYPKGKTPEGLFDMSGNVWEWCRDWYGEDYYKKSDAENPTGPAKGEQRVLRGGSWYNYDAGLRCAYRVRGYPSNRDYVGGFRCAVTL